uniref:Reverse transcriptase zinc-binding domain-containing protein n=1 Tax=Quercus lobata TaxID=97700 RepID=A0A7N2LT45_QUELO
MQAYRVALDLQNKYPAEHSQARHDGSVWRKIWRLNVPPKVRTLLWRACSNILPTRENLQRRKVQIDPKCEICLQHPETTCHVLWECPFARDIWSVAGRRIQKSPTGTSDFFSLFRSMANRLSKQELESWAMVVWAIWGARNKFYFKKTQLQPLGIVEGAISMLNDFQRLIASQTTPCRRYQAYNLVTKN